MKIEAGNYYFCKKEVIMSNGHTDYKKNKIYHSLLDEHITDESDDEGHAWEEEDKPEEYFVEIPSYVGRMYDEYLLLDDKRVKLGVFINSEIYKTLPIEDQEDMLVQFNLMVAYAITLGRRLKRSLKNEGLELDLIVGEI